MTEDPIASIVIPVWRDERELARTLEGLTPSASVEVIVACPLGAGRRYAATEERYPGVTWVSAPRSRAVQMNAGAAVARGRWLLFLHADSRLPADWLDVIADADRSAGTVAGAFRLTFDSAAWQARLIEIGVRLRVALLGLPYGDQALFVRRRVFEALGSYPDLPLMEDVAFVRRVSEIGRIRLARAPVVTSARRWERDGWFRRSAQNITLATAFLMGAPPARLAQAYLGRKPVALVMMARAPWLPGKTRLAASLGEAAHADLRHALFLDTLDVMRDVAGVEAIVACEPAEACEEVRELTGADIDVIAQRGDDLGARMAHAIEDVRRLGCESVVLIGSDLPDLPAHLIRKAVEALHAQAHDVVLGPSSDGGYYLIGLNGTRPALFRDIDWSTSRVLAQTLDAARAQGLRAMLLDEWSDIDEAADLERLRHRSGEIGASRTRRWTDEHLRPRRAEQVRGAGL